MTPPSSALDLRCPYQMEWAPAVVKSYIRACRDMVNGE